jgi:hypothetical protein
VKDIDFLMDSDAGNSNKLQKLGLEGKNQLSAQCVHTCTNGTGYSSFIEPSDVHCDIFWPIWTQFMVMKRMAIKVRELDLGAKTMRLKEYVNNIWNWEQGNDQ